MDAPDPVDLLHLRPTPLRRFHLQALRLTHFQLAGPDWGRNQKLYGIRGTFKPTIALRTIQRLGPVRHALSQRAIAGYLEINAPFAPPLSDQAKDLLEKRARRPAPDAGRNRGDDPSPK